VSITQNACTVLPVDAVLHFKFSTHRPREAQPLESPCSVTQVLAEVDLAAAVVVPAAPMPGSAHSIGHVVALPPAQENLALCVVTTTANTDTHSVCRCPNRGRGSKQGELKSALRSQVGETP
jgi:hypothetical protein